VDRSGIREAAACRAGDSARNESNLRHGKASGELSRIPRRGAPVTVPEAEGGVAADGGAAGSRDGAGMHTSGVEKSRDFFSILR